MYPEIANYLTQRTTEFASIDPARRARLEELSGFLRRRQAAGDKARLVFVCTHNSRRSHMAHLWAAAAAERYGWRIATYSGGTEATAFNPRAVAAMRWAGFRIEQMAGDENPVYHVRYSDKHPALACFSKRYDNAPNPARDFAAVMVCGEADRACPAVAGAAARFAIPYVDPKAADDTPQESADYDECCALIAREMLYVMSRVADAVVS